MNLCDLELKKLAKSYLSSYFCEWARAKGSSLVLILFQTINYDTSKLLNRLLLIKDGFNKVEKLFESWTSPDLLFCVTYPEHTFQFSENQFPAS